MDDKALEAAARAIADHWFNGEDAMKALGCRPGAKEDWIEGVKGGIEAYLAALPPCCVCEVRTDEMDYAGENPMCSRCRDG